MAAHQAPPSLGFSRQEHWSGLPFPSPMHGSEKWKWRRSVVSDSSQPYGLQPTGLLHPWNFPGKSTGVGCHCLLELHYYNHWSYIKLYIWSTDSSLVIISIEVLVIHLVIQERIILWNKQNTNGIVNNTSGIRSKYFSHEPPTPIFFFFQRLSRLGNGSRRADFSCGSNVLH